MTLAFDDIQGIALRGYGEKRHAAYALVRFADPVAARGWLARVDVTAATDCRRPGHPGEDDRRARRRAEPLAVNVALSAAGLRALGYADRAVLSRAFWAGMAADRARRATGDPAPDQWEWSDARVHAVVLAFAATAEAVDRALADLRAERGLTVVRVLPTVDLGGVEHFGFRDGISQPRLVPAPGERGDPPGEFVFGYPDARGRVDGRADIRCNGSYLVFRQLRQDVRAWWAAMARFAPPLPGRGDGDARVWLASKLVGRWPSGAPLAFAPDVDPGAGAVPADGFGYRDDPDGLRCPVGAHIRRTHPRDGLFGDTAEQARRVTERHRILRRGRPYGPPTGLSAADMARRPEAIDGADRGLHFLCLNADLVRQFEFVQQTWANNGKFGGLADDPDPLVGRWPRRHATVPRDPVRLRLVGLPEVTELRGGGYFFLPGVRALRAIAAGADLAAPPGPV
ncbi:MAG: peroxidase [Deltaproteobacteria bacterium]|nr:MAG: peroxidase [Deltaproteobacteria bacterium]